MDNLIDLLNNNKFHDIIKIKDYKDFNLNGNNILHILAIRGNKDGLEYFIDKKLDYDNSNYNGDNILHLLFLNGWDEIAEYFYKIFPDLLEKVNKNLELPITFCTKRYNTFNKCFLFMKNKQMDLYNLLNIVTYFNDNIITNLILQTKKNIDKDKYIDFLEKNIDFIDFSKPKKEPILIGCITNKLIDIAKIFINNNKGLDNKNYMFLLPINIASSMNNIDLIKLILKKNDDISYGGLDNEYLPLNIAINNDLFELFDILKMYVKNYNLIDKYKNTYLHYMSDKLNYYTINNQRENEKKIRRYILDFIKNSNIDMMNNDGLTSRTLLQHYFKLKKDKNIEKSVDLIMSEVNQKTKKKSEKETDFKLTIDKKLNNTGLFNSDILHNMLYLLYILEKYDNITIPYKKCIMENYKKELYELSLENIDYNVYHKIIYDLVKFGKTYLYPMMPSLILWFNRDLYYLDDDLFDNIKNIIENNLNKKIRYIFIKITLIISDKFTHANCILIDLLDNSIRRFEPYGISDVHDEFYLDKLLKEKLSEILHKFNKIKIKYYRPGDYLEGAKFQAVSNDNINIYKKNGDPFGYCLAWCFWYVELKLNNPNLSESELIKKASDNIYKFYKNTENPYLYFIRDYGRKLNNEKDKIMRKIKINKNEIYDMEYKISNLKKILNYMCNYFS